MPLTNTIQNRTVHGNQRVVTLDVDWDSSYPRGGESLTPADLGLDRIDLILASPKDGYTFEFDYTNNLLKSYNIQPNLIIEEVVTVEEVNDTGTLVQLPFYIIAMDVTAGSTTGPFNIVPTGETPITVQCAVTFTSGLLTFAAADDVTSVRVTYIPQQDDGPFAAGSMVIDETQTAAAATVNLTNRAGMIQYIWNDTNGVLCALDPSGEGPSATNRASVVVSAATTPVDTNATDDGDTLKITYIQYTAFPSEIWVSDADVTLSGSDPEQFGFNVVAPGYNGILVPGLGTQFVGEEAGANADYIWSGPSGTVGAAVPVWNPLQNQILSQEGTAIVTTAIPWLVLDSAILGVRPSETAAGRDMSGVTSVRIQVWGR